MRFKVDFKENKEKLDVNFKDFYLLDKGGYEQGYQDATNESLNKLEFLEVIPNQQKQIFNPSNNNIGFKSVEVNAIPDEYVIPKGKIEITNTDEVNVTDFEIAQIVDENLKSENIAEDVEVLGIKGTFRGGIDTSDGTITPNKVLKGEIGYSNDERIVGTIETYDYSNSSGIPINETINAILSNDELEIYTNNSVERIGVYKFRDGKLKVFNSTSCKNIQGQAFYNCSLEECNTPNLIEIGSSAFQSCANLKKVYFPNLTGTVSSTAFTGCTSMTYANIGAVTLINNYAFQNCSKLETIIITATNVPSLSSKGVFTGTPIESGTGYIYVLDDLVEQYKISTNWSVYASQIKPLSELGVE